MRRGKALMALSLLLSAAGCARVSGLSDLEFECFPEPLEDTCAGLACGEAENNCGERVTCPDTCAAPRACEAGGVAANTCGCTGGPNATPPPPDGCAAVPGATENTYYVCAATADFDGARAFCRDMGADLVVIGSLAENAWVYPELQQQVFLGLWDADCGAGACAFEWVDGTPLDSQIARWNNGEPNNTGGGEHCVEMRTVDGRWNDIPCVNARGVLCETTCPP